MLTNILMNYERREHYFINLEWWVVKTKLEGLFSELFNNVLTCLQNFNINKRGISEISFRCLIFIPVFSNSPSLHIY